MWIELTMFYKLQFNHLLPVRLGKNGAKNWFVFDQQVCHHFKINGNIHMDWITLTPTPLLMIILSLDLILSSSRSSKGWVHFIRVVVVVVLFSLYLRRTQVETMISFAAPFMYRQTTTIVCTLVWWKLLRRILETEMIY